MSDLDDEQFQPGGHGEDEMALPASITADSTTDSASSGAALDAEMLLNVNNTTPISPSTSQPISTLLPIPPSVADPSPILLPIPAQPNLLIPTPGSTQPFPQSPQPSSRKRALPTALPLHTPSTRMKLVPLPVSTTLQTPIHQSAHPVIPVANSSSTSEDTEMTEPKPEPKPVKILKWGTPRRIYHSIEYGERPPDPFSLQPRPASDTQKLAIYIDQSLDQSNRTLAREWEAHHAQDQDRRSNDSRRHIEEVFSGLRATIEGLRATIEAKSTKTSDEFSQLYNACAAAFEHLFQNQTAATTRIEAAQNNLADEIRQLRQALAAFNGTSATPTPLTSLSTPNYAPLLVSVFLDNGEPIKGYAHYDCPIDMDPRQVHDIGHMIMGVNRVYSSSASCKSKSFSLVHILRPGELGEPDTVSISDSGAWATWVQNVLVPKQAQVKIDMVFKMSRTVASSKKCKVDSEREGVLAQGDVSEDDGRNRFRSHDW